MSARSNSRASSPASRAASIASRRSFLFQDSLRRLPANATACTPGIVHWGQIEPVGAPAALHRPAPRRQPRARGGAAPPGTINRQEATMLIKRRPDIASSEITAHGLYLSRRAFIAGAAAVALAPSRA